MTIRFACLLAVTLIAPLAGAQDKEIELSVEIPAIEAEPYHRPYVAIWLDDSSRNPVATIALWRQKENWLKDLRQWYRKAGRDTLGGADAYSGATRKPGAYTIKWAPLDKSGKKLAPGKYILNFESVREEGGRDHVKQEIELGGKAQEFTLAPTKELGNIVIKVPAL